MSDAAYPEFWRTLPIVAAAAHREGVASKFRQTYREDIAMTLIHLHRIGVVGASTQIHPNPPEECDCCGTRLSERAFFVDGLSDEGAWASMCPICFFEKGHAIEWGRGQLYIKLEDDRWRMIAGGDPDAREGGAAPD